MSFKIAVCDDDKEMLYIIAHHLNAIFEKKDIKLELKLFKDGNLLLKAHEAAPFQAIFLDISMPGIDGFQIAELLRKKSKNIQIVFVTSKDDLVYKSFDYQPFHFIRKGEAKEMRQQFEHVVDKLVDYNRHYEMIKLTLPYGFTEEIPVSNIIMVQSDKNYLEYELENGRILRIRESLTVAEETLKKYEFIRISSRILINVNYISRIKEREGEVILKTGYVYSISRNYKKSVVEEYMKYLRSKR